MPRPIPKSFTAILMEYGEMDASEVDRLLMGAEDHELLDVINTSIGYDADKAREILEHRGVTVPEREEKYRDDS